jgi:hypothetical protein
MVLFPNCWNQKNAAYAQLKRHRRVPPTASFSGGVEPGNVEER